MKFNWNLLRYGNILVYIVVVIVNSLAGAVGINGHLTGKYPTNTLH
jgi:hypothetical protein